MIEIRRLKPENVDDIVDVYQRAFQGPPWYEHLSLSKVKDRWAVYQSKPGFRCLVALIDGQVAGAIWWDTPTFGELGSERGWRLELFARQRVGQAMLIWEREVITDHLYQRQGIATTLRQAMLKEVNGLVLTRMRTDNSTILRIAEKLGFQTTGITVSSRKWPEVTHEYWWLTSSH